MIVYLDTSAALKVVIAEPETAALKLWLSKMGADDAVVSSSLMATELACAIARRPEDVSASAAQAVLSATTVVALDQADLDSAPVIGAGLRTLDAIHLAVAHRLRCDVMVTHDAELQEACRRIGIRVEAPSP